MSTYFRENPHHWGEVVGEHIKRVRVGRGWTQGELAARLTHGGWNMSANRVSMLENCARNRRYGEHTVHVKLTVDKLMLIAEVLEVPYTYLLRSLTPEKLS